VTAVRAELALIFLLRLGGVATCLAAFAIVMPTTWMVAAHARLGLGELPQAPIVEYLTRSLSALYAMHGALLLIVATDVHRFRSLVVWAAASSGAFGLVVLGIDLLAGLPLWWVLIEGPPLVAFGVLLGWLLRVLREPAPAMVNSREGDL
jgi:hypothetical protein